MKKSMITFLMVAVLFVVTTMTSFAHTVTGNYKTTGTINGYSYKFNAQLSTTTSLGVCGGGFVCTTDNSQAPAGYMGLNCRVLNYSTGALKASSGMSYTTSRTAGQAFIGGYYNGTGTFCGQTYGAFYNGDGYNYMTSYNSPNINYTASSKALLTEFVDFININYGISINEAGKTFGSSLSSITTGNDPDLILAENQDGLVGYVKSEDLNKEFRTPQEAVDWTLDHTEPYYIPLYDETGNNVIGEFLINPSSV